MSYDCRYAQAERGRDRPVVLAFGKQADEIEQDVLAQCERELVRDVPA
jgi:hypothetical protein